MSLKCGIVGLPNVGKSTIFNAITNTIKAQAANYPFCTIEPNIGRVAIPDPRLDTLVKIVNPKNVVANTLDIVDIAGLVKGASKGEGLGNQFLANIREVDAIIHVVRCFDGEVTHVENSVDPIRDIEIIETELILADLGTLEKRKQTFEKKNKGVAANSSLELTLMDKCIQDLGAGKSIREIEVNEDEKLLIAGFGLITSKPTLYVANVAENELKATNSNFTKLKQYLAGKKLNVVPISAVMEMEMHDFSAEDKMALLSDAGFGETALGQIIKEGYKLLDLITFFTAGVQEVRAWSAQKGASAPEAAGKIHTDFIKNFIRAEVTSYDDFVENNGSDGAKAKGKMRVEGKEYIVQDGDVIYFRIG